MDRRQPGMLANNLPLNQASVLFTPFPGGDAADEESRLREDLNYFFMSPCEKYRARRQFPWKLCLQVGKIVMVTTQLILFGLSNQLVASFKEENAITFKHLFLKGYQGPDGNDGSFIIYTQQEVYSSMLYTINQYLQLQNMTVGNYAYDTDVKNGSSFRICKQLFMKDVPIPSNSKLGINTSIVTECLNMESASETGDTFKEWKISNLSFFDIDFHRLILIEITFKLKGIDLQTIRNNELPDCYEFAITITFDNTAHSGLIKIKLESETTVTECKDWKISGSRAHFNNARSFAQGTAFLLLCWHDLPGLYVLWVDRIGTISFEGKEKRHTLSKFIEDAKIGRKFERLSTVAECLFSLINGDDMFATFAEIQEKSNLLWLFSRIYLYSFISLFIYMVLSLFIALITDTYETIKKFQLNGFPQTDLHVFMRVCTVTPELSRRCSSENDDQLLI
ncbi:mucolipin-2-like isoform X6 [Stegostoma tigrinum]|uniref:mucolipin-2-like isoform X6 n=1 Tax=Stegostoma tigrinum TaxID=3053191 RepID=UPI00202B488A|nr:mucolipin-2-like isoform X6 [Stegostoma tigrinum]